MFRWTALAAVVLVLVLAVGARGEGRGWEPVGLSGGGGMYHPVISPIDSKTAIVHCDMSEAFLTHDGGETWRMIHTAELRSSTHCRAAFHPTNPKVIYSPSGQMTIKVSRDGGDHWEELAKFTDRLEGPIGIDPRVPERMVVGVGNGVQISADGGKTWEACPGVNGTFVGSHFAVAGGRSVVYAATSEGVWRSEDGGKTWADSSEGLPVFRGIRGFSGGTKDGNTTLYCTIPAKELDGKYAGGIYRWQSGGKGWESAMGTGLNMDLKAFDQWAKSPVAQYFDVATTDVKPETVWASNSNTGMQPPHHATVYRSDDGGKNWRATFYGDPRHPGINVEKTYMTLEDGQYYQHDGRLAVDPRDPEHVLQVQASWCYFTNDGGKSWISANGHAMGTPSHNCAWTCSGLEVTTTWHYYIDPHETSRHYICYTDIGFSRSLDGGKTWVWWAHENSSPWRNTCYELAFDPDIPGKISGAFSNLHDIPNDNVISGRHGKPPTLVGGICVSENFADTWKVLGVGGLPVKPATSIIVDPKSPKESRTLYAGFFGVGVFKSTDGGATWSAKNKGLGDPANMRVYRVALHADGTLFAVITALQKDGKFVEAGVGLYRSKDGGDSWECISKSAPAIWPKDFTLDPKDSRIVYLGLSDAKEKKVGGLYRTKDGGTTWELLTRNGPQHFGAYLDPRHPGWIYATLCEGSPDYGLFLSKDDGKTFAPVKGLPFDNAMRVTFDPADAGVIYVSTFGGSVWKGPAE